MQVLYGAGFERHHVQHARRVLLQLQRAVGLAGPRPRQRAGHGDEVTGRDIWEINANESVGYQYSRFHYNVTDLYSPTPVRVLRPQPEIVGLDDGHRDVDQASRSSASTTSTAGSPQPVGRRGGRGGARRGGRSSCAARTPNTVFAAAGDLIGASTFESFIQHDKPTIDALNAAGLDVSSVGNHEFDQGYDDLVNRVMADVQPHEGGPSGSTSAPTSGSRHTGNPALPATWIKDFGDVEVGFVGAVTEHLPELVSPDGIADIEVTDIVAETNAAATELKDEGVDIVDPAGPRGCGDDRSTPRRSTRPPTSARSSTASTPTSTRSSPGTRTWPTTTGSRCTVGATGPRGHQASGRLGGSVRLQPQPAALPRRRRRPVRCSASARGSWRCRPPTALATSPPNYPGGRRDEGDRRRRRSPRPTCSVREPLGKIGGAVQPGRRSANGTTENRGGESTLGNLVAEVQRWATESATDRVGADRVHEPGRSACGHGRARAPATTRAR